MNKNEKEKEIFVVDKFEINQKQLTAYTLEYIHRMRIV